MVRRIAIRVLLSILLIGLVKATAQQQSKDIQDNNEIKLSSDLILVNVTVTNTQGQFIRNLTKDHFSIKEEGKPQKIEFFGAEQTPFAVAVMLDVSGSMEDKIRLARAALAQFADQLREDDVMSIYRLSDEVKQIQDFSNSHDISDYVWDLKANGETMIYDCLVDAVTALSKREERRR